MDTMGTGLLRAIVVEPHSLDPLKTLPQSAALAPCLEGHSLPVWAPVLQPQQRELLQALRPAEAADRQCRTWIGILEAVEADQASLKEFWRKTERKEKKDQDSGGGSWWVAAGVGQTMSWLVALLLRAAGRQD
jgi:hypothetical protein